MIFRLFSLSKATTKNNATTKGKAKFLSLCVLLGLCHRGFPFFADALDKVDLCSIPLTLEAVYAKYGRVNILDKTYYYDEMAPTYS